MLWGAWFQGQACLSFLLVLVPPFLDIFLDFFFFFLRKTKTSLIFLHQVVLMSLCLCLHISQGWILLTSVG